jgi:predicted nucleic acid-binding protein
MKLYLDSMIWVYILEGNPISGTSAREFLARMRSGHHEFLSSNLVLAEVLVLPKRNSDVFTAAKYRRLFTPPGVTILPFSTDVAERFADLRASTRVKPADALHLALAASAGTDYFVTTDTKLHSLTVAGIARICPPEAVA